MRRSGLAIATFVGMLSLASGAYADPTVPPPLAPPAAAASAGPAALAPLPAPAPSPGASAAPSPVAPAPAAAPGGVAVVAMPGATDAAWPLAQSVYSTPAIRPYSVDEVHARVLCGEAPPPASPGDVRDLAETVAALRGEDAASRAILADMAHRLNVRALVVVHLEAGKPVARVFVADAQSFDAASYAPDAGSAAPPAWSATTASLSRSFGAAASAPPVGPVATAPLAAPPLATHEEPVVSNPPPKPKAFYESGWFWGALGAAAFAGGAVFFATRDNGAS